MSENNFYETAKSFVYRNARPLDFALFRYHFEEGAAEDVLRILASYQNSDGGFGHALEPDNWNPASTPIATWAATQKLRALGIPATADGLVAQKTAAEQTAAGPDKKCLSAGELAEAQRIIDGILRYLDSGADFADGKWYNTVAGNNDYPHAVWWSCENGEGLPDDNPTVSLAGFALCYADKGSSLYEKAEQIITKAVAAFIEKPTKEMHVLKVYLELLSYLEKSGRSALVDMESFREALYDTIRNDVCKEPEKWYTEYVCKPSVFYDGTDRLFTILDRALCEKEAELILKQQCPDGAWNVTWQWHTEYKEFEISANWWKSSMIIDNLLYLKALGKF
ncbi:MAG: hypothetical protein J6K53_00315 [Roseburia sp.]|nr:hypothetical protein [Roseburia sp.]